MALNLDTGNFREDPYAEIEQAAPSAVTAHVKVHFGGGAHEEIDYPRIVSIFNRIGYAGYLSIEYEAAEDPITGVPGLAGRLRDLIRR